MKTKFIHIAQDEKFINSACLLFEKAAPGLNEFYIFLPKGQANPEYVHTTEGIYLLPDTIEEKENILKRLNKNDVIFLHSLSPSFYPIVLGLPSSMKIILLLFGFEVYNDPNFYPDKKLLAPITRNAFPSSLITISLCEKIKDSFRPFAKKVNNKITCTPAQIKKSVFKRIDYVGLPYEEEFQVICSRIRMKKKFFNFTYFPLERIVEIENEIPIYKPNIMIGHSGYRTGNHLDVFDLLQDKIIFTFKKVILPLSYGDKKYIDRIMEVGSQYFLEKFDPILTFQSLQDYNNILKTVGIAILYNRRQQGIGNTIALIWFGTKVFLSKYNSFYKFLKSKRITVYSIEDDLKLKNSLTVLDLQVQIANRAIIKELFRESKNLELLETQLKKIIE